MVVVALFVLILVLARRAEIHKRETRARGRIANAMKGADPGLRRSRQEGEISPRMLQRASATVQPAAANTPEQNV